MSDNFSCRVSSDGKVCLEKNVALRNFVPHFEAFVKPVQ